MAVAVFRERAKLELIYGMGDWIAPVGEVRVEAGSRGEFGGEQTAVAPIEELLWSKAFLATRERNNAGRYSDHLIEAVEGAVDWQRLLHRSGDHCEVISTTSCSFRTCIPPPPDMCPDCVMDELVDRFDQSRRPPWLEGKESRGQCSTPPGRSALDFTERGDRDAR